MSLFNLFLILTFNQVMESKSLVNDKSEQTEDEVKLKTTLTNERLSEKPLKSLLKKTNSFSSEGQPFKKEKKKVKFAETITVFWDDASEDFFPCSKTPASDFNFFEIGAQDFMFEPPIEYQDLLPFDPPPDYRDCVQSSFSILNSINACDANSSITFIDNENSKNEENILMKLKPLASNLHWENKILNEPELLEEDIIDVLKKDEILQAIGFQATDLDNVFHPPSHEDQLNADDFPIHYQSEVSENDQISKEIKEIQGEKNSLFSETCSDIASETEEICSDIASDSSFTSQDTIILTNAISLNKKIESNSAVENKVQTQSSTNCFSSEYQEIDVNLEFEPKFSKPILETILDEEEESDFEKKVNTKLNENLDCQELCVIKKNSQDINLNQKVDTESKLQTESNVSKLVLNEAQAYKENLLSSLINECNSSIELNETKSASDTKVTNDTIGLKKEEIKKIYPQKVSIIEKKDVTTMNNSNISVTKIAEKFERLEQQSNITVELRNKLKGSSAALSRPKSFPSSFSNQDVEGLDLQKPVKIAKLTNLDIMENLKRLSLNNDIASFKQYKNKLNLKSLPKEDFIIEYTSEPRGAQQALKTRNVNTDHLINNKSATVTQKPNVTANQSSNESKTSLLPSFTSSLSSLSSTSSTSSSSSSNSVPNPNQNICCKKSNLSETHPITIASSINSTPVNQNSILHSLNCIHTLSPLNFHTHDLQSDALKKQISQNVNINQAKTCIISQHITPCNCSHPNLAIQQIVTHDPSQSPLTYRYYSIQQQPSCQATNRPQLTPVISHIVKYQIPNRQILCIPRFYSTNLQPSISFNQPSPSPLSNKQNSLMSKNIPFPNPKQIRRLDGLNSLNHNQLKELSKSKKNVTVIKPSNLEFSIQATETKDELVQFVEQDIKRIEKIRKRYSLNDEDDDPTFGFGRRPSVRGIKPQYSTTNNILKQMQLQMRPCLNKTIAGQTQAKFLPKQGVFLSQSHLPKFETSHQPQQVYFIPQQPNLIYSSNLETNISMPYSIQKMKNEQIEPTKLLNQESNLNLTKDSNVSQNEEIMIDKTLNSVSASKGLLTTKNLNDCLFHNKTISMPNIASIESSSQVININPIKDERGTPEGASSSPTHTTDLPYLKATIPNAINENTKEVSNLNNNPDLVKDVTSSSLKGLKGLQFCLLPKENSSNVQTGSNDKEAVIYYSMNV